MSDFLVDLIRCRLVRISYMRLLRGREQKDSKNSISRILCVYQIWMAIDKYFQYGTTVTLAIEHMREVAFPAVTLCSLNPVRKSWLDVNERHDNLTVLIYHNSFINFPARIIPHRDKFSF